MEFTHHEFRHLDAGELIQVVLSGTEANVKLLDEYNFGRYRSGQTHRYYGGHYRSSPVLLATPAAGSWHVVVDLGGYRGTVRSRAAVVGRR